MSNSLTEIRAEISVLREKIKDLETARKTQFAEIYWSEIRRTEYFELTDFNLDENAQGVLGKKLTPVS